MNGYIYDLGYGTTTKSGFQSRLVKFFPANDAVIVDVRKAGSGSRNGKWAYWGSINMGKTCIEMGMEYWPMPGLSNEYGNTKKGFARYVRMIDRDSSMRSAISLIVAAVLKNDKQYCLLCAELKPYTGKPPSPTSAFPYHWSGNQNCHRVIITAQLTARLWFDHKERWVSGHLY